MNTEWQTKALDACMESYLLRHDEQRAVRLYLLDPPDERRFLRPWTEEEVLESERLAATRGGLLGFWVKRRGEGEFLPEAFLPENRRQRSLGELPHQWVEIYTSCTGGAFVERWLKFTDGVVTEPCHRLTASAVPLAPSPGGPPSRCR